MDCEIKITKNSCQIQECFMYNQKETTDGFKFVSNDNKTKTFLHTKHIGIDHVLTMKNIQKWFQRYFRYKITLSYSTK